MPSMPRLSVEDLRSTIKTLRKEKRTLGVQVRSLTRRLATAEKKIVGQRSKKPKETRRTARLRVQRDAQPGYEYSETQTFIMPIRDPPPDKILPGSYLMMSPDGKVAEMATPIKVDGKVVWARWPCTANAF